MYHRRIRDSFLVRMIVDIGDMKIIDFRVVSGLNKIML